MGRRGPKMTGPEDSPRNRRIYELREAGYSHRAIYDALVAEFGESPSTTRIGAIIKRNAEAEVAGVRRDGTNANT